MSACWVRERRVHVSALASAFRAHQILYRSSLEHAASVDHPSAVSHLIDRTPCLVKATGRARDLGAMPCT